MLTYFRYKCIPRGTWFVSIEPSAFWQSNSPWGMWSLMDFRCRSNSANKCSYCGPGVPSVDANAKFQRLHIFLFQGPLCLIPAVNYTAMRRIITYLIIKLIVSRYTTAGVIEKWNFNEMSWCLFAKFYFPQLIRQCSLSEALHHFSPQPWNINTFT